MRFIYNDGGRSKAGYKGNAHDCVVRAFAIAMGVDYKTMYNEIARRNKLVTGKKSARNGVAHAVSREYLREHGWVWCKAPQFSGRKARCCDLPDGMLIAKQANHLVAVADGVPHDTFESSSKMVYGYCKKVA